MMSLSLVLKVGRVIAVGLGLDFGVDSVLVLVRVAGAFWPVIF